MKSKGSEGEESIETHKKYRTVLVSFICRKLRAFMFMFMSSQSCQVLMRLKQQQKNG